MRRRLPGLLPTAPAALQPRQPRIKQRRRSSASRAVGRGLLCAPGPSHVKASSGVPETDHRSIFLRDKLPRASEVRTFQGTQAFLQAGRNGFYIFTLLRISLKLEHPPPAPRPARGGGVSVSWILTVASGAAPRRAGAPRCLQSCSAGSDAGSALTVLHPIGPAALASSWGTCHQTPGWPSGTQALICFLSVRCL